MLQQRRNVRVSCKAEMSAYASPSCCEACAAVGGAGLTTRAQADQA